MIIRVAGTDAADSAALCRVFDGVGGFRAVSPDGAGGGTEALLVVRRIPGSGYPSGIVPDPFVPLLAIADDPSEAILAIQAGAGDVVLASSSPVEMRLRAELLAGPSSGKACTSSVFSRILRAELGRAGREGNEMSLISIQGGWKESAWALSEEVADLIRSTDTSGVVSDGAVVVLLPLTPPERADVVARRLRSHMLKSGRSCVVRLTGGSVGQMTAAEVLKLLADSPETL